MQHNYNTLESKLKQFIIQKLSAKGLTENHVGWLWIMKMTGGLSCLKFVNNLSLNLMNIP